MLIAGTLSIHPFERFDIWYVQTIGHQNVRMSGTICSWRICSKICGPKIPTRWTNFVYHRKNGDNMSVVVMLCFANVIRVGWILSRCIFVLSFWLCSMKHDIVSDSQKWSGQHFLNRDSRFHALFLMKWKHHELLANTRPWDVQPCAGECNRIHDGVGSFCHFNWSSGFCPSTVSIENISTEEERTSVLKLTSPVLYIYIYICFYFRAYIIIFIDIYCHICT